MSENSGGSSRSMIMMGAALSILIASVGLFIAGTTADEGPPVAIFIMFGIIGIGVVISFVARTARTRRTADKLDEAFSLLGFQSTGTRPGFRRYKGAIHMHPIIVILNPGGALQIVVREPLRTRARVMVGTGGDIQFDDEEIAHFAITAEEESWAREALADWDVREGLIGLLGKGAAPGIREVHITPDRLYVRISGISPADISEAEVREWVYHAADLTKALTRIEPDHPLEVSAGYNPLTTAVPVEDASTDAASGVIAAIVLAIVLLVGVGIAVSFILSGS